MVGFGNVPPTNIEISRYAIMSSNHVNGHMFAAVISIYHPGPVKTTIQIMSKIPYLKKHLWSKPTF